MSPLDALWHLLNFFAPPLGVAALLVGMAKGLVWRELLRPVGWRQLYLPSALLGCAGQLLGLLLLGHEGKLAAYALWLSLLCLPLAWRLVRS